MIAPSAPANREMPHLPPPPEGTPPAPGGGRAGRVLAVTVAAFAAIVSWVGVERESYNADETQWMIQGDRSFRIALAGDWSNPFWSDAGRLWGCHSPPVSKFAIGAGMALFHRTTEEFPPKTLDRPYRPPADVVRAARFSSVLFGAAGIAVFHVLAARIAGVGPATLAAILLALHPVWLVAARRAMTDIHVASFALAAIALLAGARQRALAGGPGMRTALGYVIPGAVLGLAVGSKFSGAGPAAGLGALTLADAWSRRRRGAVPLVAGGALLAIAAVLTFWGPYVYLHEQPWTRFSGTLAEWKLVATMRADHPVGLFAEAYHPGWRSVREFVALLLLPGGAAAWLLLLPVLGAFVLRRRALPEDPARAALWILLMPAAFASLAAPGRNIHAWIGWIGMVGAIVSWPCVRWRAGDTSAAWSFLAASAGSALFIGASTHISWARYYILLLPACALLSAIGWVGIARTAGRLAGRPAVVVVGASVGLGLLSGLAAFPDYGGGKMATGAGAPAEGLRAALHIASAVCLGVLPLLLARGLAAARQRGPST